MLQIHIYHGSVQFCTHYYIALFLAPIDITLRSLSRTQTAKERTSPAVFAFPQREILPVLSLAEPVYGFYGGLAIELD